MIGPSDVKAAAALLDGVVTRTPVLRSRVLSELVGTDVWLKCENLQRTGSFKIRGAYTRLSRMSDEQKAHGVVAASAGNHAQGVALAAQMLGIEAVVFMPEDAALPKVSATKAYGARVIPSGATLDDSLVAAQAYAQESGAVLVHPFDHVDIVAGQGTAGLEIAEQVPDVRTVLVPVGGGGLAAGIVASLEDRPDVQVIGVQASHAAAYPESLAVGHPVKARELRTMADGIAVGVPGKVPFEIISTHRIPVLTVAEEDLSRAMLLLAERAKLVVEASGSAGVAALMAAPEELAGRGPVVVVLSGGNVDPLVLMRLIRHGLAAAGRFLHLRITIQDSPGALAGVLRDIAAFGANVLDVVHLRTSKDLAFDEVAIEVEVETKGPEHCTDVVRRLREAGYRLAD
ncbi:MAG: threonine ammonia-lyase [Cellulomonas sp. 73-92]|uniref:threonine ammonia-lyase n=1 Tax=Cellulomonas sp. 73-92 TaxID=1895740 RepID=UPI000928C4E7|nr:threonine ammonia-lyase [Cellulomonas sp. 73-92]OJV83451.1 MAG: threonine ammonia-lyase [Cellulomonas sp. 73-92]